MCRTLSLSCSCGAFFGWNCSCLRSCQRSQRRWLEAMGNEGRSRTCEFLYQAANLGLPHFSHYCVTIRARNDARAGSVNLSRYFACMLTQRLMELASSDVRRRIALLDPPQTRGMKPETRSRDMFADRRWLRGLPVFSVFALTCMSCATIALAQMTAAPAPSVSESRITTIPSNLDPACRTGRATLYDECSDQLSIFDTAMKRAAAENKVLLISYGAEWCIWCHVFAKYIHGERTRFEYTYGRPDAPEARQTPTIFEREKRDVKADAAALNAYVARSFVVVHIEGQYAANGAAITEKTGAAAFMSNAIPFIFAVDRSGQYAAHFKSETVEIRRDTDDWYRGYDRRKLLAELQRMHDTASR